MDSYDWDQEVQPVDVLLPQETNLTGVRQCSYNMDSLDVFKGSDSWVVSYSSSLTSTLSTTPVPSFLTTAVSSVVRAGVPTPPWTSSPPLQHCY